MRLKLLAMVSLSISGCALGDYATSFPDAATYRPITLADLAQGVRNRSLPQDTNIEVTATVDGRFSRQIVIDLRTAEGQVVSRRDGDCLQVLLPLGMRQSAFDTGRYVLRGFYRDIYMDKDGFKYEQNAYEPACGAAYFFARSMERVR